jgi:hypothetical protein
VTAEQRQKLREAAQIASRGRFVFVSDADPGPWALQTSNSFRRIGTFRGDGDVLCAVTQRSDGHPDLHEAPGVLDYIIAAQPRVVLELLDYIDKLELHSVAVVARAEAILDRAEASMDRAEFAQDTLRKIIDKQEES